MKNILGRTAAPWLLMVISLFSFSMRGVAAGQFWVERYNGSANGDDEASAVAVDAAGNVFVTGYSSGTGTGFDYVTIKFSPRGTPLWTNRYNGPGNGADYAQAVAVDGAGNVCVTGYSRDSLNAEDYVTIKYSGAGVPLWTNRYNGPANGSDLAYDLALDGSTNVWVTGRSFAGASGYDFVTITYSSAGVPLWTNRYNGPGNGDDGANALAMDGSDNVCVTGYSLDSGSGYDYATIKYSSVGVPQWTNRYSGLSDANSTDVAVAVAVDGSNNVCVTGYSLGSASNDDYVTIKYSAAGIPLWTNRYNGTGNGRDDAKAMAVDGSNNIYVTGFSSGGGSYYDYATIKYSSTGVPLWTNRFDGPVSANDHGIAVAVDNPGNVFVTGYSDGGGSANDYATLAYSTTGLPLWTNRYNGPANGSDQPLTKRSLALASNGAVVVVGKSHGINAGSTNYDWAVITYANAVFFVGMTNLGPATWQLFLSGTPGLTSITQVATNLSTGPWFNLSTNTADTNSLWTVIDASATNRHRFYRAIFQ